MLYIYYIIHTELTLSPVADPGQDTQPRRAGGSGGLSGGQQGVRHQHLATHSRRARQRQRGDACRDLRHQLQVCQCCISSKTKTEVLVDVY